MLQIVEVELKAAKHLLHSVGVAIVESGIGGDSWTQLVELGIAGVVLHDFVDEVLALRAGTYE